MECTVQYLFSSAVIEDQGFASLMNDQCTDFWEIMQNTFQTVG